MKNYLICSMSKIYESESFHKSFVKYENFIDCSEIPGINCYADKEAIKSLRDKLSEAAPEGIHFIDSGNFHYMTYLFLEKIERDFELVLIDKHPDCKIPMFEELVSCGGWVRDAIFNLSHLKRVYMIGTDESLLYELDDLRERKEYVTVVRDVSDFNVQFPLQKGVIDKNSRLLEQDSFKEGNNNLPIYLSIDKDVLDKSVVTTNWDQGDMTLEELDEWIAKLKKKEIIGVDICGECDIHDSDEAYNRSNDVNLHLISAFLED
ncbi:MAG: arginase family protein [Lachnospiraceae bacterium]|nr:arginase family protein [Lachnospiraceae bacterium]